MTDGPASAPRPRQQGRPRRPGPAAVVWGSLALFAVLFAMLTSQIASTVSGSGAASRPTIVRKVVKRRVVTTFVPTPGHSTVTSGPVYASETGSPEAAPVTTGAS